MRLRNRTGARRAFLRPLSIGLITISALLLLISAVTSRDVEIPGHPEGAPLPESVVKDLNNGDLVDPEPAVITPPGETAVEIDEAVWEGDDIIKLPKDPEKRRAALDELYAKAAAVSKPAPEVSYQGVQGLVTEPDPVQYTSAEQARRMEYEPTQWDLDNMNVKLPDNYELPQSVIQELQANPGKLDESSKARMATAISQSLFQSFGGIDQTNLTPPDCDIAAGPNHIVVVVNAAYAVYDYCGVQLAAGNLNTLGAALNGSYFDPKVVYDEWNNRWILICAVRNSGTQQAWIKLIASTGTLPPGVGGICAYSVVWTDNGGWWGDYPDVGFNNDTVVITTNDFNWNNPAQFQRSRIVVFDSAVIYSCSALPRFTFFNPLNPNNGTQAFTLRPAEMKSLPGDEYYLVNSVSFGGSFLSWWEITGAPAAPVLNGFNINVGAYNDPPNMAQGNGTFADCGDARLLTAKYYVSRLWTTHAQEIVSGGSWSALEVYIINSVARTIALESGPFWGGANLYYCYPAVDFDPLDRGTVTFTAGGTARFPEARYVDITETGGWNPSSALLQAGSAWKSDGANAGTNGDPFRLGDYNGMDLCRDGDNRTLWMYNHFASNSPVGSWDTQVGAVNFEGAPLMNVTPTGLPTLVSTGLVGGPFTPGGIVYNVANIGGARLQWTLSGLASWNTASALGGFVNPGGSTNISVNINGTANGFARGTFTDNYSFTNCIQGGATTRSTQLTIGVDGSCEGSVVNLVPPDGGVPMSAPDDNQERGVYITALKDFQVCSLAMKTDLVLPQTITARIYRANGTTRGALVATGSLTAVQPGLMYHYIPINYTLQECQEYEITFTWATANSSDYWSEPGIAEPFDIGGVIRVRDGSLGGNAGNSALFDFSLIGSVPNCPELADLEPGVPAPLFGADGGTAERGIFVKAENTISVCSFGWFADAVPGITFTANIYESAGLVRGPLVASGTFVVTGAGEQWHDVSINAVLEQGKEYDLSIAFDGVLDGWEYWDDQVVAPFTIQDVRVLDGHRNGVSSNFALPHFRVNYGEKVSGAPFSIAKSDGGYPPPFSTGQPNSQYGAYVESLIDQEMTSLGWFADVPEGQPITARVYAATGVTRGALISEGTVLSSGPGLRWHDVPVAASLITNGDYDFAITWVGVNEWRWWNDNVGMKPFDVYGTLRMIDSESNGNGPGNSALPEIRYCACNATATAISGGGPLAVPKFTLSQPYPNPVSTSATIDFSLDEPSRVTMAVYNVQGQRVATLLEGESRPVGASSVQFDGSRLAAGVYFVKMNTNVKSVTRKITIVR